MKKLLSVVCLISSLFLLASCKGDKKGDSDETVPSLTPVKRTTSQAVENISANDVLAEEFVKVLMVQKFDEGDLDKRQAKLRSLSGDSSLNARVNDIQVVKSDLVDYKKTKKIRTSASAILVERDVVDFLIYKKNSHYFLDITFKESSPAYSGEFERRRAYNFEIKGGKIYNFEEVLWK